MRATRRLGLCVAVFMVVTPASAEPPVPQFSAADTARLEGGEVLVKSLDPKGGGIAGKAAGVVRASPDRVWDVINDCAHYKDFMPRTVASERLADGAACKVEISMPFPFSNLWSETKVQHVYLDGGGRRRQWSLLRGTYKTVEGSWTLWPWKDGQTLLLYVIEADPDVPVPNAILRSAQESTLPDMYTAIRARSGAPEPKR